MRLTKTIEVGVLACALAIFAISPLAGCRQSAEKKSPGPQEVAVVELKQERVLITTELTGRTAANRVADVRPQVGGIILKRLFTEGSDVKAGQVLYQIDPATYQAALDNAKASLSRSEASLTSVRFRADRYKELLPDKAVSRQEYDDAQASLKQAEADIQYWKAMVDTARINLKYTSVTAPISGRIGKSSVTEGALVTANQATPLAVIQQLDPMYVDVPQSTSDLMQMRRNLEQGRLSRNGDVRNTVLIILEDNSRYPQEGKLQFRDISVDSTTGSVILRVIVPNPKGILLPGMFIRAIVEEGVNRKALLIPQQAVFRTPKGDPYTMIVDAEGKVQQKMLVLDRAVKDKWLVTSGVGEGERVIVEGTQKVRPGASVKAVPFAAGTENKQVPAAPETPKK
jgi:membrane fusion protein (multidrug efflux system)